MPTVPDPSFFDQLKRQYFAHYAAMNQGLMSERFYRNCCYYFRGEVVPILPDDRDVRILEIGCGVGTLIRFLGERGYRHIHGIEIDPQLCDTAVQYAGKYAKRIECGDALKLLGERGDSFDVIIAMDVIEHFTVAQGAELCRLAHRALKPGGKLLLRTPNMGNIVGNYLRHVDLTHQAGYTEASLRHLLLSAGFARADVVVPKFGWPHLQTVRLVLTNLSHRLLFAAQGVPPCVRFDPNIVMCAQVDN